MPKEPIRKNPKDRRQNNFFRKLTQDIKPSERDLAKPFSRRAFIDCHDARIDNFQSLIESYYKPPEKSRIEDIPGFKIRKRIEIDNAVKRLKEKFRDWQNPMLNVDSHYAIVGFSRWAKISKHALEKKEARIQKLPENDPKRIQFNLQRELLESLLETSQRLQRTQLITGNRERFIELVKRKARRKQPEKRPRLILSELLQAAEDLAEHSLNTWHAFNKKEIFEAPDFGSEATRITTVLTKEFEKLLEEKDLFPTEREPAIKSVLIALNELAPNAEKRIFIEKERNPRELEELEFLGASDSLIDKIQHQMERKKAIAGTVRALSNAIRTTIRTKRKQ